MNRPECFGNEIHRVELESRCFRPDKPETESWLDASVCW